MVKVADARNIAQGPSLRDPGVRVPDAGAGVGQALSRVGAQLQAEAEEVKRKEQQISDLQFETEYRTQLQEEVSTAVEGMDVTPDDPAYVERFRETVTQAQSRVESRLKGRFNASDLAVAGVQSYGSNYITSKIVVARADSNRARVKKAVSDSGTYLTSVANAVTADPQSLQDATEEANEYVSSITDIIKSETVRGALLSDFQGKAAFTHLEALSTAGQFDEAEELLDSGDYNDVLTNPQVRGLRETISKARAKAEQALIDAFDDAADEVIKAAKLGLPVDTAPVSDLVNGLPERAQSAARARVKGIENVTNFYSGFAAMSRNDRKAAVSDLDARLRSGPPGEAEAVLSANKTLETLRKIDKDLTEQENNDAVTIAAGRGKVAPAPDKAAATISDPVWRRWSIHATDITSLMFYGNPDAQVLPVPAYNEVRDGLKSEDEFAQVEALRYIGELSPISQAAVLSKLGSEVTPATRVAISLAGAAPVDAQLILRGDRLLRSDGFKGIELPNAKDMSKLVGKVFGTALPPSRRAEVAQAAIALFVAEKQPTDPVADADVLEPYIERIIPEGLITDFNGQKLLLPDKHEGLSGSDLKDKIRAAGEVPEQGPAGFFGGTTYAPAVQGANAVGTAVGVVSGRMADAPIEEVVDADGRPVPWEKIVEGQLGRQVAPGVYPVMVEGAGGVMAPVRAMVEGSNETHTFLISLDKLSGEPGEAAPDAGAEGAPSLDSAVEANRKVSGVPDAAGVSVEEDLNLSPAEQRIVDYHRQTMTSGTTGRDEQGRPITVLSTGIKIPSGPYKGKFVSVPGYVNGEVVDSEDRLWEIWKDQINIGQWPIYDSGEELNRRSREIHQIMDAEASG